MGIMALAAVVGWMPSARADDYGDVNTLRRSGKLPEALARADQYIATKPRDPQMRFLKGVILAEAGRAADAIATYRALNQEYPELPEPYNNLAVLYASQGEFDKAREALEQAVRANPAYAVAYENLGDVYAKLAGISYGKAQQLEPTNTAVAPKLALIRQLLTATSSANSPTGAVAPAVPSVTPAANPASSPAKPAAAAGS